MIPQIVFFACIVIIAILIAMVIYFKRQSTLKKPQDGLQINSQESVKSSIILNYIDDGVILTDANNVIQLFNPGAGRITGWTPEEATGIDYRLVLQLQNERGQAYQETDSPFYKALTNFTSTRDNQAYLLTKSKTVISLDIDVTPLIDDNNTFQGFIGIFRDVSAKRKEEQQRADFISTASHEMRTPVAAIEGYLSLALNDNVSNIDNKARGFLLRAHENSKHLGKLFQDLLASSKAEDGRLENNPILVEMGELIGELIDDFKIITDSKGLGLEYLAGSDSIPIEEGKSINKIQPLFFVNVDPNRIREVITNIFDNAIKYTSSGKISIGLTGDESVIQIWVSDTGIGIAPENINHLFQKFYRVDTSQTQTIGGTGLGLFITKKIIEMYGGRIWVESELGSGSTFFINIPRIPNSKAMEMKSNAYVTSGHSTNHAHTNYPDE